MVVCDSGEQAVTMNNIFLNKFKNTNLKKSDIKTFHSNFLEECKIKTGALILHDEGSKKKGKIL